jgi:hypothetical protein
VGEKEGEREMGREGEREREGWIGRERVAEIYIRIPFYIQPISFRPSDTLTFIDIWWSVVRHRAVEGTFACATFPTSRLYANDDKYLSHRVPINPLSFLHPEEEIEEQEG